MPLRSHNEPRWLESMVSAQRKLDIAVFHQETVFERGSAFGVHTLSFKALS